MMRIAMAPHNNSLLVLAGLLVFAAGVLHIAIMLGGVAWYEFFRAPLMITHLARVGSLRAPISCMVIACILFLFSSYAFSGAGHLRPLPWLKFGLAFIGVLFLARALLLIPLVAWQPVWLGKLCNCRRVDLFLVVTSIVSFIIGIGYVLGARAR